MHLINHASAEALTIEWMILVGTNSSPAKRYPSSDSNKHVDLKFSVKYVYVLVVLAVHH